MKILLFGVSNVGKTTVGKLLAEKLGYKFYDLDEEVKKHLGVTIEEFVHTSNLRWRDQQRGRIIKSTIGLEEDMVFSITPISHPDSFVDCIIRNDILLIELYDTPENIFSRIVFSDENDVIYTDDDYKSKHRDYYLNDIQADLDWYGYVNSTIGIKNRIFVNNDSPELVCQRIIAELNLKKSE